MRRWHALIMGLALGAAAMVVLVRLAGHGIDWGGLLRPRGRQATPFAAADACWVVFGFAAQVVFMARFAVQWLASERAGRSVVPVSFWFLSLAGGLALATYFIRQRDLVGIAGQGFGVIVYCRNLWLIMRERERGQRPPTTR
jgi:lipid-A-disaccharide synthase-like uncharacterized protein